MIHLQTFYFICCLLCCFLGICADIALSKHEHWSSLAPLPFEVVISAGQKAKEDSWDRGISKTMMLLSLYLILFFISCTQLSFCLV